MHKLSEFTRNHYVPKWYQYRFFEGSEKEKKFYYLDMKPEVVAGKNGKKHTRRSILRWGPPRCFYKDHLYTTKFMGWESTEIEENFFGIIDKNGKKSVEYFSDFCHPSADHQAFEYFLPFMSVQKLRTPKGLAYLSSITRSSDRNKLLIQMQRYHRMHC